MSDWTQQRRDDYAAGYEFARQELLANGERVEWCETHGQVHDAGVSAYLDCHILSKLLSDYPKEAENE